MSWVSENKFLTGLGAVVLAGVGTLGYLTYSAMDKYDGAASAFDTANAQLKRLHEAKPALKDASLKALLAQQNELTEKITAFHKELKSRVLPMEAMSKVDFQNRLKESVAQISAKAANAGVERPKDFYLGFGEYQARPPDEKATPALARELRAIELVMNVLIKAGNLDLDDLSRTPLREEGGGGSGKRKGGGDRADRGLIERDGLLIKFTSTDKALREVLAGLANHKEQLFVIRNVAVQNKVTESPPRAAAAPPVIILEPTPGTPVPVTPAPAAPVAVAPVANEAGLAYVFGTEKITSIIELEVLNIEEPKAGSEKPEKGAKKKDK